MRFLVVFSLCMLASPAIALDNNAPGQGEVFWSADRKAAKDDEQCQALGAKSGTPIYVQCRLMKEQQRAEYRRGQISASQRALQNFNATRPRNCTTQVYGSTAYTNCF